MKPVQTLSFFLAVILVLFGIMLVMPAKEIPLGDSFSFRFPTLGAFITGDTTTGKSMAQIDSMLNDSWKDSDPAADPARRLADSIRKANMFLQYPDGDKSILAPFFESLMKVAATGRPLRILHYGDSQIEGERMTAYIRSQLQARFGGSGPGLIPIIPVAPFMSVRQSQSDNWRRYTMFGERDKSVTHQRYGVLANFARFTPALPDSAPLPDVPTEAWIRVDKSGGAYARAGQYQTLRLFYGGGRAPVQTMLLSGGQMVRSDSLRPGRKLGIYRHRFSSTPADITLNFAGTDSPEFYGLSLEGDGGVIVDNISMRGSSGTIFTRMDQSLLQVSLDSLNVKLFLLQYGGNYVPDLKDAQQAVAYGLDFRTQIRKLKSMVPDACVIVLGPSDMSDKTGDTWTTFPFLTAVRDELRKAAFECGAAYFDIYEVMGGRNSMPVWVNANPQLAGEDHVHFTPEGARKVAEQFYKALIRDYEEYRLHGKQEGPAARGKPSPQGKPVPKPAPKPAPAPAPKGKPPVQSADPKSATDKGAPTS